MTRVLFLLLYLMSSLTWAKDTLITSVRILDFNQQGFTKPMDVLIRDGKISQIAAPGGRVGGRTLAGLYFTKTINGRPGNGRPGNGRRLIGIDHEARARLGEDLAAATDELATAEERWLELSAELEG